MKEITSLLSLVLLSCMLAPIRDFGNKFFSYSLNTHSQQTSYLPTVLFSINTKINILTGNIPDNYNEIRDRTSLSKTQFSKKSSVLNQVLCYIL